MTQADLGKAIGTSGDIIGKYERWGISTSINVAAKIANALDVTIDYLTKPEEYQHIDNEMLKQVKLLGRLSTEDKSHAIALLDALIAKAK